jgi:hypothetical protein
MDIWALQTPLTANPASSRQGFTDAAAGEIERIWADKPACGTGTEAVRLGGALSDMPAYAVHDCWKRRPLECPGTVSRTPFQSG